MNIRHYDHSCFQQINSYIQICNFLKLLINSASKVSFKKLQSYNILAVGHPGFVRQSAGTTSPPPPKQAFEKSKRKRCYSCKPRKYRNTSCMCYENPISNKSVERNSTKTIYSTKYSTIDKSVLLRNFIHLNFKLN